MKKLLRILSIAIIFIASFFVVKINTTRFDGLITKTTLANPASIFCLDNGGTLEIVTEKDGRQIGMCTLVDGTECEERAYMRGECGSTELNTTTLPSSGTIENMVDIGENILQTHTDTLIQHQGYITQIYTKDGINYLNIDYTEDGPEGDGGAPEIINNNPMIRTFAIDNTAIFKVLKYVSGGPELQTITRNEFQARGSRTRAENNPDMDNPIYYGAGDYSIVVIEHDDQKIYTITEIYRP